MHPAIAVWLAKNVVAQDAWTRAVNAIGGKNEYRRLEKAVAGETGFRPRRGYREWLNDDATWKALVERTHESYETLVSTLAASLQPTLVIRRSKYLPAMLRDRAETLVGATIGHFLSSLDPSQAVAVAHYREMSALEGITQRLDARGETIDRLAELPPVARGDLVVAAEENRTTVDRILAAVMVESDRGEAIEQLVAAAPQWLEDGSARTWRGLAQASHAYGHRSVASRLYERVAELGLEPARHLALAALEAFAVDETARADDLIARSLQVAPKDRTALVVKAVMADDGDGVIRAAGTDPAGDPELLALVAEAHARAGDADREILLYRESIARYPDLAGHRIRLAQLLLQRAFHGRTANRGLDLRDAQQLAIEARNARRAWRGPSAAAVIVACHSAVLQREMRAALRLALPPPDGEALPAEAADPDVRHFAAGAALTIGDLPRVRAIIAATTQPFRREVLTAELLQVEGRDAADVQPHYDNAWELAPNDEGRFEVQLGLAHLGVWPVPGLEELTARDEVQANLLNAMAEAQQGHLDDAIQRLRRYRNLSEQAAVMLAQLSAGSGNTDIAVETLMAAAERFDNPEHLVVAAHLLYDAGRHDEAQACAGEALARAGEAPKVRRASREILTAVAQQDEDWPAMEALVRALIADDGETTELRWLLVGTLFNQRRLTEAWASLNSPSTLEPDTEQRATMWVQLQQWFHPGADLARHLLDMIDTFGTSEQFMGAAIGAFYTLGEAASVDPETVARWQIVTQNFLARFPESRNFFAITIGETAEERLEAIRPFLEPGAAEFAQLQEQAAIPAIPYGMLAAHAGRPYAAALLQRAAGCLPTSLAIPAVAAVEIEAARAALGGKVVTDASTLHLMSLVPDLWPPVVSTFSSIQIADASRHDLVAAIGGFEGLTTTHMGWDVRTGRPVFTEISSDVAQDLLDRARWMHAAADQLDEFRSRPIPGINSDHDRAVRPWMSPLDHAKSQQIPLYSDDAGLRMLARGEGIATFGTIALLNLLEDSGRLANDRVDNYRLVLSRHLYVDLPLPPDSLVELAAEADWKWGAATLALARPAFWRITPEPLSAYQALCRAAASADRTTVPIWVYAASLGATTSQPPEVVTRLVSVLTVAAANATQPSPSEFADIIGAARQAAAERGGADPFLHTVTILFETIEAEFGPGTGASALIHLVANLDQSDRTEVVRHVLGLDPSS